MRITKYILQSVLYLCMIAPVVRAEEFTPPPKHQRETMSYREYSDFREKMRDRMHRTRKQERQQTHETENHPPEQSRESNPNSTYGQGYNTRNPKVDRPDNRPVPRQNRARAERFRRSDR